MDAALAEARRVLAAVTSGAGPAGVLGVGEGASVSSPSGSSGAEDGIALQRLARERFRALALALHPDRQAAANASDGKLLADAFVAAKAAYEQISDGGASVGQAGMGRAGGASAHQRWGEAPAPPAATGTAVRRARESWGGSLSTSRHGRKGIGGRKRPGGAAGVSAGDLRADMGLAGAAVKRGAPPANHQPSGGGGGATVLGGARKSIGKAGRARASWRFSSHPYARAKS